MKVRIKSARDSFWRAGRQFTREGVIVDWDSLSPEEQEALQSETNLHIGPMSDAEIEAAEKAGEIEPSKPSKKAAK